ncbi:hypothetical protein Tco_1394015 [Tanacetum coccineum]
MFPLLLSLRASEKDPTAEVTTTPEIQHLIQRPGASREEVDQIYISYSIEPAKAKVQEQMSLQLARELQENFSHEDQSIREQMKEIAEIGQNSMLTRRSYQMINDLDRSNSEETPNKWQNM